LKAKKCFEPISCARLPEGEEARTLFIGSFEVESDEDDGHFRGSLFPLMLNAT